MTIEQNTDMQIPTKCPRCGTEFILDTTKWPPQRYCSKTCSQYVRTKKWREKKAKEEPQDGTSDTAPSDSPKPHEGTPES